MDYAPHILFLAFGFVLITYFTNSTCSVEDEVDLDHVQRYCYDQFSDLGCSGDQVESRNKKLCARFQKCLEDPLIYAKNQGMFPNNKSGWTEFL